MNQQLALIRSINSLLMGFFWKETTFGSLQTLVISSLLIELETIKTLEFSFTAGGSLL